MRNAGIHANSLLEVRRMYNAVGIDVSKGKSTVAVLQPGGTVIRKPFDVSHTSQNLNELYKFYYTLQTDKIAWSLPLKNSTSNSESQIYQFHIFDS